MPRKLSPIAITARTLASSKDIEVLYDPPASEPTEGEFVALDDSSLHPSLLDGIRGQYVNGLFAHQHQAIERVLAGRHTVTATRTSSGKSLTFALPALDALCRDGNATGLFLYPQKALASDQLQKIQALVGSVAPISHLAQTRPHLVSRYDSGVDKADRPAIREQVQLLLTNPDMLHLAILQHHGNLWSRFFANLKIVAIDECHEYRGIFGSNVALVLRRLREICRIHGSDPVFTASSATISDPQEHLRVLNGHQFELVGAQLDRSRQGRRKFWVVGGETHHYDIGRKLAVRLAEAGLRVLAFCPSRVAAEKMLDRMRRSDGSLDESVSVYRSGLSSLERSRIERGLRDGSKRLVFSTSALELGIDIGELDVVICIGLPTTMMSLWQRAGRVARAGREGAIILVPGNSPIDSYYSRRPDELFARENESIAINVDNERIVRQHYACAIAEQGGDESSVDVSVLGPTAVRIRDLRSRGELKGEDEFYRNDPHGEVNLRASGDFNYELVCGRETLGEIGMFHLLREAPRNAIYRHGGQTYRVQDVILGKRIVRLQREATRNETIPFIQKNIKLRRLVETSDYGDLRVATGRIEVTEFLQTLTEKDPSGQVKRTWVRSGGMPSHKLPTEGTLLILKSGLLTQLQRSLGGQLTVALESVERLLCGLFPTIAGPCDPQDFSSGTMKLGTGEWAIVLYDMAYNGIGLTEAAFRGAANLVEKAMERIRSCGCEDDAGCIRCVASPQQQLSASKSAALTLLRAMSDNLQRQATFTVCGQEEVESEPELLACPDCQATVRAPARFCMNCGHKLEEINV